MTRTPAVLALTIAWAAMPVTFDAAEAARIETGPACSLVDAIASANTNAPVAGCIAGDPGRDTVVVTEPATTLSAANNGSNGLPVVTEDLRITSPAPAVTSLITPDATVGTPEFRFLEIGTATAAPEVILSRLHLQNGRVSGSIHPGGLPAAGAGGGSAGRCRRARRRSARPGPSPSGPPG